MSNTKNKRLKAIIQTMTKSVRKMLTQNGVSCKELSDAKVRAAIRHALTLPLDDGIRISRPVVKFQMFPETIASAEFRVTVSINAPVENGLFSLQGNNNCRRKKFLEKQLTDLLESVPTLKALKHINIDIDVYPLKHVLLEKPLQSQQSIYSVCSNRKSSEKQIILMPDLMDGIFKAIQYGRF